METRENKCRWPTNLITMDGPDRMENIGVVARAYRPSRRSSVLVQVSLMDQNSPYFPQISSIGSQNVPSNHPVIRSEGGIV